MTIDKTNFIFGVMAAAIVGFIFGVVMSKGYYENLADEIINDEVKAQVKRFRQMDERKNEEKVSVANDESTDGAIGDELPIIFFITKEQYENDEICEKVDLHVDDNKNIIYDDDGIECEEYDHILKFALNAPFNHIIDGVYIHNELTMIDYYVKKAEGEKGES